MFYDILLCVSAWSLEVLKRSTDTSGIGKRKPVTHINIVSGRGNDKDKEKDMTHTGLKQRGFTST